MTFSSAQKIKLLATVLVVFSLLFLITILPKINPSEKIITLKNPSFQQLIKTVNPDIPISVDEESLVIKSKKELSSVLIETYDTPIQLAHPNSIIDPIHSLIHLDGIEHFSLWTTDA